MRRNTPLITLLAGAALGVILLISSMLTTPSSAPVSYSAAAASSPAAPSSAAPSSAEASSPAAASSPASSATPAYSSAAPAESSAAPESPAESSAAESAPASAPSPEPTRTTPTRANYAGRVGGGGGSVAVSVHGDKAIAYVCNGATVEGWMRGKVENGKLVLTGKNKAHLTASYHAGKVTGDVEAHGTDYSFSVSTVNKSSGLYQATAVVQGKTIKAGWIVLGDGTQIGSLETDADSDNPVAVTAPKLDVATMTAQAGGLVLHAVPVSGVTGTGF
jgi:hypothetical protein